MYDIIESKELKQKAADQQIIYQRENPDSWKVKLGGGRQPNVLIQNPNSLAIILLKHVRSEDKN